MDNDTETRRLSPVAILSDNGYLDLINGPPSNLFLKIILKILNKLFFILIKFINGSLVMLRF
jgi:hypothetical protein